MGITRFPSGGNAHTRTGASVANDSLKNIGTPNVGGTIATAGGLVFVAATNDRQMLAFESATGRELWNAPLDATGSATPITYLGRDGRQYLVIAAGGPAHLRNVGDTTVNHSDSLIAFALGTGEEPEPKPTAAHAPAPRPVAPSTRDVVRGELPEAAGKALVTRVCCKCHGVATFASKRMSRGEWQVEVDDMIARGAEVSKAEARRIVDYLAAHLGPIPAKR
jgi:outer membrane protein assembly factor BamB